MTTAQIPALSLSADERASIAVRAENACPAEAVSRFQTDGFIHLRHLLPAEQLAAWRQVVTPTVRRQSADLPPLAERDTYGQAFLQISNIWEYEPACVPISLDPFIGAVAARLLGCSGIRLYHDQALYKEGGGGHTPWHVDQVYWPLADARTVTAWIPLVPCPLDMGPLCFAKGSHELDGWRHLTISDTSHSEISRMLHEQDVPRVCTAYELGDVSFHYGWTAHCAGPNRSEQAREVMTIIMMADDIRMKEPESKSHHSDRRWMPGIEPGDIVASELNPPLW